MKNKKLFAILTLICFALTMMPVAAFAATATAEVDDDYSNVKLVNGKADVKINVYNTTGTVYAFAVDANGALYKDLTASDAATATAGVVIVGNGAKTISFADAGSYTVYVAEAGEYARTVVGSPNNYSRNAIKNALMEDAVVMGDNTVVVNASSTTYTLTANPEEIVAAKADSGFTTTDVTVTLVDAEKAPVSNATLTVSTNSSAVTVDKETVKTNGAGQAKIKVSTSVAGNFKVYVEYGTKADVTIKVAVGALTPAVVTNIYEPAAPIALDQGTGKSGTFKITDANGNVIKGDLEKNKDYKVAVVSKPAASSLNANSLSITYNAAAGGYKIIGGTFDAEGSYTLRVMLNNGSYASTTVTVKEFQTPVALRLTYKVPSVELDGYVDIQTLQFVDANGVTKDATAGTDVTLSASGYAIESFRAEKDGDIPAGRIYAKSNESYVGSTINVIAVSEKYNLVAQTSVVVAKEAAAVKWASNTADVAVNNTIVANIVDEDGNKVALNDTVNGATDISYVVLSKPAGAKVAVSTADYDDLNAKGTFKVSFTASAIGEYQVQTVVRYEQTDNDGKRVVKYYSGIETITVGNTGISDVVVMSVGSNAVVVNDKVSTIDAAPIVKNSRTFVPFRALAEAFGATVAYDEATQSVTAELNGTTVVMTIGSATYTVNGTEKTMDVAPFISSSRTYVPVRFAAEAFGIKVTPTYDENGATADILFCK